MRNINTVTLAGRLTRDAELKSTSSGMQICSFSLAVNSSKKVGDEWQDVPNFFDCVMFGRLAERLYHYLTKGRQIFIAGSLKHETWESKEGQKRSRVVVNVNDIELGKEPQGNSGQPQGRTVGEVREEAQKAPARDDRYEEMFQDDIPESRVPF